MHGVKTVSAGILNVTNDGALGFASGPVAISNTAELDFNATGSVGVPIIINNSQGFQNIPTGGVNFVSGTTTLTGQITLANANGSIDLIGAQTGAQGIIAASINQSIGNVGLTKVGAGTLTLQGNFQNTYVGTTTVAQGVVQLNVAPGLNALGTGAVTVGNEAGSPASGTGAQLVELAGNQIARDGAITVTSSGKLDTSNAAPGFLGQQPFNNQQIIEFGGLVTGGAFTLTFEGQVTAPVTITGTGPTTTAIQNALASLPTIGAGNVTVTGQPGYYIVTFGGALANVALPGITVTVTTALTGTLPTIAGAAAGGAAIIANPGYGTDAQTIALTGTVNNAGSFTLTVDGEVTAAISGGAANAAAAIQTALAGVVGAGNVTVLGPTGAFATNQTFVVVFAGSLQFATVPIMTAVQGGTAISTVLPAVALISNPTNGQNVQNVAFNVAGTATVPTAGSYTLALGNQVTVPIAFNAPLSTIQADLAAIVGTGNVTVVGPTPGTPVTGTNYTVIFGGALGDLNLPPLVGNAVGLTAPAVTVTSPTPANGVGTAAPTKRSSSSFPTASPPERSPSRWGVKRQLSPTTSMIPPPRCRRICKTCSAPNNVVVTGSQGVVSTTSNGTYYLVKFTGALAGTNLPELSVNPVTPFSGGTPKVSTVTVGDGNTALNINLAGASSGSFTVTVNGAVATDAFNDSAATVQSNIQNALNSASIPGTVVVLGSPGSYTVIFEGAMANLPQTVSFNPGSVNGAPTSSTIAGGLNAVQAVQFAGPPFTTGAFDLALAGQVTSALYVSGASMATPSAVQAALLALPNMPRQWRGRHRRPGQLFRDLPECTGPAADHGPDGGQRRHRSRKPTHGRIGQHDDAGAAHRHRRHRPYAGNRRVEQLCGCDRHPRAGSWRQHPRQLLRCDEERWNRSCRGHFRQPELRRRRPHIRGQQHPGRHHGALETGHRESDGPQCRAQHRPA